MPEPKTRQSRIPDKPRSLSSRGFTRLLQATIALLGALQSFFWRGNMDADGMSYIDVAYAYLDRDWAGAVNGYWSPLFSWELAGVFALLRPSAADEFPIVDGVNFINFLVALAGFSFFLSELVERFAGQAAEEKKRDLAPIAAGFAAFGYGSVVLQNVGRGGPDFLLSACFYVAAGLMLRLSRLPNSGPLLMAGIGLVLGAGYLAKAVLFPIGFVMLACVALMLRGASRPWLRFASATIAFGLVSGPWVLALTSAKGRLTYSDTGKLAYAWYVNDAAIQHAQKDSLNGTPSHPSRRLSTNPTIYEFAEPVRGSYPVWYDPSYWHEGIEVRPRLRLQTRRLAISTEDLFKQSWFFPTLVALIAFGGVAGRAQTVRVIRSTWFVIVPVVAGFGMYALVLVLGRHIAPFFVAGTTTLIIGMSASLRSVDGARRRAGNAIAAGLGISFGVLTASQLVFVDRRMAPDPDILVAEWLHDFGLPKGARVGSIGNSMRSYWARLGRFKIIAEIPSEEAAAFWAQDSLSRGAQLHLFREAGAVAVLAHQIPSWADKTGWIPAGHEGYWLHHLSQ